MGVKSFFQKLFGIDPNSYSSDGTQSKLLNGSSSEYAPYTGELYANSYVRGIVHRIASYGSMMSFEHIRGAGDSFEKLTHSPLNRLLTVKPNDFMSPADLQYKFWTDLLLTNNAYQWLKRDSSGEIKAILPVVADHKEFIEIKGFPFYRFSFSSGDKLVVPASDVVHIRRFYYKNDIFGEDNAPLRDDLGLLETMNVSLDASLKNGAQIKGILQHQNTVDPEDLARHEKMFRESYLKATNAGGIGMLDAKFNFIPISYNGKIIDHEQMKEIRDYVNRYFGVNDKFLLSEYTSDQWQSIHEGVISPELNKMAQAYTIRAFTDKELGYLNRVVPSVNLITFMSPQQRISMVKLALDGALYTRNEIRAWFGDGPVEGGDTFQYSKNFTEDTQQGGQGGNDGQGQGEDGADDQAPATDPSAPVQEPKKDE